MGRTGGEGGGKGMRNEGNNRIYSFFFFPWQCNLMPEHLGMEKRESQWFHCVSLHKYKCMNVFMCKVHAPVREPVAKAKSNWFECFWKIFSSVLRRSQDDYWLVNWLIGIRPTVSQQHHHSSYGPSPPTTPALPASRTYHDRLEHLNTISVFLNDQWLSIFRALNNATVSC